jgi:hypothetical protein
MALYIEGEIICACWVLECTLEFGVVSFHRHIHMPVNAKLVDIFSAWVRMCGKGKLSRGACCRDM